MRFFYKGEYEQIKIAVEDSNDLLFFEDFYKEISSLEDFKCSKKSPKEIAEIIKNSKLEVEIKLYKPKWVFSKVNGYFVPQYPNQLFLNARKIWRDSDEILNTIIHEYIHALDYNNNNELIEFGHDCGIHEGTAPYVIGNLAQEFVNGNKDQVGNQLIERDFEISANRII